MAEEPINFDLIESHKENIAHLPSGRSAKALASIFSPQPSSKTGLLPTSDETRTLNDAIRHEYETELLSISESDDPLDIYDRYVKWTLSAYPSAQATPQSQLLPLLERATKAFLTSSHYKNDPRYLKLWLHYIRLFDSTPRETFAFLARHKIGEGLGLFYEEFAAWLEGEGRWAQADEVLRMGVEKEARPVERLGRRYEQFQQRWEVKRSKDGGGLEGPSSPALPSVRPALAAKVDPFAAGRGDGSPPSSTAAAQQQQQGRAPESKPKSGKTKMAIFSDADNEAPPLLSAATSADPTKGWNTIASINEGKKENTFEARSWTGETLKAGNKRVGTVPKMEIFKDTKPHSSSESKRSLSSSKPAAVASTSRSGRAERVFVDLDSVYPANGDELSLEELRAKSRGWLNKDWSCVATTTATTSPHAVTQPTAANAPSPRRPFKFVEPVDVENLSQTFQQKIELNEQISSQLTDDMSESKPATTKQKRLKVREVKQETQTVKARLDSPTGPKIKRKASSSGATAEPTMTFHSKAATNDIYDIFNHQSTKPATKENSQQSGGEESDFGEEDDTYSTAGESVGTDGRISPNVCEYGGDNDTMRSFSNDHRGHNLDSQREEHSLSSPWSDFTASSGNRAIAAEQSANTPKTKKQQRRVHRRNASRDDDFTDRLPDSSQDQTIDDGGAFDTQAIAAFANQDFGEMDTKMIAQLAGDEDFEGQEEHNEETQNERTTEPLQPQVKEEQQADQHELLKTPVEDIPPSSLFEVQQETRYVPIPPEGYEPTPMRPYRDTIMAAQNKLPFMTPIVERTESSMAPSTVFQDPDFFAAKTPSRSVYRTADNDDNESPSKIEMDNLLLQTPEASQNSSAAKRRRSIDLLDLPEEEDESSPSKKLAVKAAMSNIVQIPPPVFDVSPAPLIELSDLAPIKTVDPPGTIAQTPVVKPKAIPKSPIILDLQCNPCDPVVQQQILSTIYPPITSYEGYTEHPDQDFDQHAVLKAFARKEKSAKTSPRKSTNNSTLTKGAVPPILRFSGASRVYAIKKELGKGAFAPVYLVDSYDPTKADVEDDMIPSTRNSSAQLNSRRAALEAMKTDSPPLTLVWEFHILRLLRSRLTTSSPHILSSFITAHECHLYRDESYLLLDYQSQGTVLDLVNLARTESSRAGKPVEGLEETVAMWFAVELLRALEALHAAGIMHGDLKADNCLVRFEPADLLTPYTRTGDNGWSAKGLTLIDFGRGIDTRAFRPEARFVADWSADETDCAEIREARPWRWALDLFGAAGVVHSLLFGRYIETVAAGNVGLGQKKEWRLKEGFKRYWEREVWSSVFSALVNGGGVGVHNVVSSGGDAKTVDDAVVGEVGKVRVLMEDWLEREGEKGGRDLRGAIRRCERLVGCGSVGLKR